MMKKHVKYMVVVFMAVVMLCGLNACSSIKDNEATEQIITEVENEQTIAGTEGEQFIADEEEKQIVEQDSSDGTSETAAVLNKEDSNTEKATSSEDLDVVVPNAADDDWYMKGSIYKDDKGNQLEVFFNDHGTLEFAVNGISMYFAQVDNFEQENNWKIYTCDDGTMIAFYPGDSAHLEISDGEYAGLYAE